MRPLIDGNPDGTKRLLIRRHKGSVSLDDEWDVTAKADDILKAAGRDGSVSLTNFTTAMESFSWWDDEKDVVVSESGDPVMKFKTLLWGVFQEYYKTW